MPLALAVWQERGGAHPPLQSFCQDERRWGLLTLNGRLITLAGIKPAGVYQPAYTPEVNLIEPFWKHLKTPLQWEIFKHLKALRQRVNTGLSAMTEDVIRSVTGWEFITDAVLSVSSN